MAAEKRFKSVDSSVFDIMKNAKSKNTVKQYEACFKRFQQWCLAKEVVCFPAKPSVVAVFLVTLFNKAFPKQFYVPLFTV